jgi:hypothetical protein
MSSECFVKPYYQSLLQLFFSGNSKKIKPPVFLCRENDLKKLFLKKVEEPIIIILKYIYFFLIIIIGEGVSGA